jgi:GNAT superfamily N-acetyltransferase
VAAGPDQLTYREGTAADLAVTFDLSERAMHDSAVRQGVIDPNHRLTDDQIRGDWLRHRALLEFIAAQPEGRYVIAEDGDGPVGYARVVRFGAMEELTELMVSPANQGGGIGRSLLERCWPGDPTPELGRVVVAAGAPSDLSLYTEFGVMPVSGHWHMRQRTESYLARRAQESDAAPVAVHALSPDNAVNAWERLEPPAIAHRRSALHQFFCRDRSCLAVLDAQTGEAKSLCWVSSEGEIGPAVACTAGDLVPVVLGALDRVAKTIEPEFLSVFTTTISWWLLRRLRTLGFTVFWPGWVMCSEPLPGLDRYTPTRPPHLL